MDIDQQCRPQNDHLRPNQAAHWQLASRKNMLDRTYRRLYACPNPIIFTCNPLAQHSHPNSTCFYQQRRTAALTRLNPTFLLEKGTCRANIFLKSRQQRPSLRPGSKVAATIRKRLGHKNIQTTLRYAEQSDEAADAELRAWRRQKGNP